MTTIQTGEAYILRTCDASMRSRNGFEWPRKGHVLAPDWRADVNCGGGLHGFLWGEGDAGLASWDDSAVWVVAKVTEWIDLKGKVKFPGADVVFAGSRHDATQHIYALGAKGAVIGISLTGGDGATLTGGDGATLTGGDYATLTGGDGATLTGGDGATLTGGNRATLTGGDYATLVWRIWDRSRYRIHAAYVGEGGIKANTPYRWIDGKATEVAA